MHPTFVQIFSMGAFKSVFISLFVAFLFFHATTSIVGFVNNDTHVDWLASLLAAGIPLFYFLYIYVWRPAEVRTFLLIVTSFTTASLMIVLGYKLFETPDSSYPLIGSAISLLGWILYTAWYAKLARRPLRATDLSSLTEKFLLNSGGQSVNPLEDAHKYRLFILHRGAWCPMCVAQVKSMAKAYSAVSDMDVQLNFISPQQPSLEERVAAKFNFPGNFLQDTDLRFAKSLGLKHDFGLPFGFQVLGFKTDTILPTVILTNREGLILHTHQTDDYRNRPEPEFFMRLIRAHENPPQKT
jgi:peroxiredoxin